MKSSLPPVMHKASKRAKRECNGLYVAVLRHACRDHRHIDKRLDNILEILDSGPITDLYVVERLLDAADELSGTVYPDPTSHYVGHQISSLIKKYPFPVRGVIQRAEAKAWDKFVAAEQRCSAVNLCLRHDPMAHALSLPEGIWQRMRDAVQFILGCSPDLDAIKDLCDFGPGANLGVHGDDTSKQRKLLSRWSVSPGAIDYARAFTRGHAQIHELLLDPEVAVRDDYREIFDRVFHEKLDVVVHNSVTFVPKTTRILRSIAVEPLLNSFIQKGADMYMRDRLKKRLHIDLSDQSRNSEMAREGSFNLEGCYCTIDLSSASDSIATEVVRRLLPPDWFYFLDRIRSKSYQYKGKERSYSKFCSMGNGFCFPLQTILFSAVCIACDAGEADVDFRVYGDDIIVRDHAFGKVIDVLSHLGFSVNPDKTFGPGGFFRESCGEDYFMGVDVRPVALDYQLDSLQAIFKLHNSFSRSPICLNFGHSIREFLFRWVDEKSRFVAPDYSGVTDGAFARGVSSAEFLTSPHVRFQKNLQCWSWKELGSRPIPTRVDSRVSVREAAISLLYGALSGSESSMPYTYRRKTRTIISRKAYEATSTTCSFPPVIQW